MVVVYTVAELDDERIAHRHDAHRRYLSSGYVIAVPPHEGAAVIRRLEPRDRAGWEVLARGYKDFDEKVVPPAGYDEAWQRLLAGTEVHGLGAWLDGHLVGIVHYLFHAAVWSADYCYLQDLFVDSAARGRGVARALIERVATEAHGCGRLYWTAKQDNSVARALYDKVARFNGFIRYEYPLDGAR
jgi:GNAT superfamily N-acetyltransferase